MLLGLNILPSCLFTNLENGATTRLTTLLIVAQKADRSVAELLGLLHVIRSRIGLTLNPGCLRKGGDIYYS